MTGPLILSSTVDPPIPPASVETLAMAMAREQALDITDDRRAVLRACAYEVERWTGMVLWPGEPAVRACASEMELGMLGGVTYLAAGVFRFVNGGRFILPVCPLLPNPSGATVAVTSVQVWDVAAEAYEDPPEGRTLLPGGRVMVEQAGTYRVVASLTAPAEAPAWAVEGLRRYFAWRERRRPAEGSGGGGGGGGELDTGGTQAGGLMKSGAAEVLRAGRMRVAV